MTMQVTITTVKSGMNDSDVTINHRGYVDIQSSERNTDGANVTTTTIRLINTENRSDLFTISLEGQVEVNEENWPILLHELLTPEGFCEDLKGMLTLCYPFDGTLSIPVNMGYADFVFVKDNETYYIITSAEANRPEVGLPIDSIVVFRNSYYQHGKPMIPYLKHDGIVIDLQGVHDASKEGTGNLQYKAWFQHTISEMDRVRLYARGKVYIDQLVKGSYGSYISPLATRINSYPNLGDNRQYFALIVKKIGDFEYVESVDKKIAFTLRAVQSERLYRAVITYISGMQLTSDVTNRLVELVHEKIVLHSFYNRNDNGASFIRGLVDSFEALQSIAAGFHALRQPM